MVREEMRHRQDERSNKEQLEREKGKRVTLTKAGEMEGLRGREKSR